ncbi:MAG: recombinase family protein [Lachnospiraceae bacterium]|nr:recombinase family protein [Lachnospiraceae bacterium]
MKIGYARVSTKSQETNTSLESQKKQLLQAGADKVVEEVYTGTTMDRPAFTALVGSLQAGDELMVTKLDRFARTASEGMELCEELINRGVTVNVLNMGVLDNSLTGKLIRNIFLCFAEYERDMIHERMSEGRVAARLRPGYRDGRKPKFTTYQMDHAMELHAQGQSYAQVERITGISKRSLIREMHRRQDNTAVPSGKGLV